MRDNFGDVDLSSASYSSQIRRENALRGIFPTRITPASHFFQRHRYAPSQKSPARIATSAASLKMSILNIATSASNLL